MVGTNSLLKDGRSMKRILLIGLLVLVAEIIGAQEWRSINSMPQWANIELQKVLSFGFTPINQCSNLRRKDVKKEIVDLLDNLYKYSDTAIAWAYHTRDSVILVWTDDCKIYTTAILWRY